MTRVFFMGNVGAGEDGQKAYRLQSAVLFLFIAVIIGAVYAVVSHRAMK